MPAPASRAADEHLPGQCHPGPQCAAATAATGRHLPGATAEVEGPLAGEHEVGGRGLAGQADGVGDQLDTGDQCPPRSSSAKPIPPAAPPRARGASRRSVAAAH